MSRGFLLAVRKPGVPALSPEELARRTGLRVSLERPGFTLLTGAGTGCLALGEQGVAIGSIFPRHGPARPITDFAEGDVPDIVQSNGRKLVTGFWGGYVALIANPDPHLLRDPSGALPCYMWSGAAGLMAASSVDLLLAASSRDASIDWDSLAIHLYSAGLPRSRTVLAGVCELLPGFCCDPFGQLQSQRACWTPWAHVEDNSGRSEAQGPEHLRRLIRHAVRSVTAPHGRVLLSLSGGLDSSIVAACLADAGGPEVHCLTMFGDDPGGDERDYARALCAALGLALVECRYRVEDVDIDAPLGAHLPRPFGRTQANAYEGAHLAAAAELGIDAFVTGNGGDNVFGYSQSAAAAADRYLSEGMGAGLLRTLRDVCRQTGCSMLEAAGSAVRLIRSPPSYRWKPRTELLHADLLARLAGSALDHPWLDAPPGAMPGKAGHIAAILRVLPNLEPGRSRFAPVLNPLVSQPIMEACLAIPSWRWRGRGFDRAVARDAFAKDLPELIVRRRSKGGPDGFTAQLVRHYRAAIRERLLDGHLAAQGLVDVAAIERMLADDRPTLGEERTRLLSLLSTEAWLRFWVGRSGPVRE